MASKRKLRRQRDEAREEVRRLMERDARRDEEWEQWIMDKWNVPRVTRPIFSTDWLPR